MFHFGAALAWQIAEEQKRFVVIIQHHNDSQVIMSSNNYSVHIRPLQASDAPDVARIWTAGLEQSKLAVPWYLQSWFFNAMKKDMHQALSPDGDVGPDGANLTKTYNGDDRCMMVASLGDPPQVVGLSYRVVHE